MEKPDAQVLAFPADVADTGKAKEAIAATIECFGRRDVVVANAGVSRNTGGKGEWQAVYKCVVDVDVCMKDLLMGMPTTGGRLWRSTSASSITTFRKSLTQFSIFRLELIRDSYAVPELKKTKGAFITTTSHIALLRLRTASDYAISKFAVNRLIEFAVVGTSFSDTYGSESSPVLTRGASENPEIRAFAVHPGVVDTESTRNGGVPFPAQDSIELSAAVYHIVTSRQAKRTI